MFFWYRLTWDVLDKRPQKLNWLSLNVYFYSAMLCYANAVYAMAVSAHLSVTRRCCTKKTGRTELVFGMETPFHLSHNVLKNLGISENYGSSIWNFVTNSRLEKFCHGKSIALPTALVIVLHSWVCWRHYTTIDELWLCTTSQSTITPLTL